MIIFHWLYSLNHSLILDLNGYSWCHLFSTHHIIWWLIYSHELFCSIQLQYFWKMKLCAWKMHWWFFTILLMKYQDILAFVRNLSFGFINSLLLCLPFLYSLFEELSQSFLCFIKVLLNMIKSGNWSIFILTIFLNKFIFSLMKNRQIFIINLFFLTLLNYLHFDWLKK